MTLKQYLAAKKIGPSVFAKKAGLKQSYASLIINRKRCPSLPVALVIEKVTKGAVTMKDLQLPSDAA